MVCAMGGARRRRGFEPRFVRPSRGPLASSPPRPPSASPSTTGTADGWVACLVLVVFTFGIAQFRPQSKQQSAEKNKALSTTHLQQCPTSLVPPADGSRVSSSYSPSAGGFEPASLGQQPAAQPLRYAAKSQGWGPLALIKPMLSYGHEFSRDKQVT